MERPDPSISRFARAGLTATLLGMLTVVLWSLAAPERASSQGEHPHTQPHANQAARAPALSHAGDATFGALSEVVEVLAAEAATDWSRVDLDALREHLVDMSRVSSQARLQKEALADGFRARVSSTDPLTAAAIRRMVPAHSRMMQGHRGWRIEVEEISGGVQVTVRTSDAADGASSAEARRLHGLGFFGFLASGDHHRRHHWMMATGGAHMPKG